MVVPKRIARVLTSRHIVLRLIATTFGLVVGLGVLMSLLDRKDFPSIWLGIWWAVGTVSTVGYGDVVPVELSGRLVASAAMIVGIAFISLLTATVASALVASSARDEDVAEEELLDAIRRLDERLVDLERALQARRE
ncbi:MAG TPA: potassium channel family protein [Gaiellaceae bacterium]|nr:potassium channel family protein [Gaiellaceae bacterium]